VARRQPRGQPPRRRRLVCFWLCWWRVRDREVQGRFATTVQQGCQDFACRRRSSPNSRARLTHVLCSRRRWTSRCQVSTPTPAAISPGTEIGPTVGPVRRETSCADASTEAAATRPSGAAPQSRSFCLRRLVMKYWGRLGPVLWQRQPARRFLVGAPIPSAFSAASMSCGWMRARSPVVSPPQMPWASGVSSATKRQSRRIGQRVQIWRAAPIAA